MDTSTTCGWLTEQLADMPLFSFPFDVHALPENGIYFFYEKGEVSAHGARLPRIVRIGTHRNGNFRSRISEHYLLDDRKMAFDRAKPTPHDRSIFRKNIGRVILNRAGDPYLAVWEIDFMKTMNCKSHGHLRDLEKDRQIETEVTCILRENFSFRFIKIEDEQQRFGVNGFERQLIGTVARCMVCGPSEGWFGNHSPVAKIRSKGLWQVQHLESAPLSGDSCSLLAAIFEPEIAR